MPLSLTISVTPMPALRASGMSSASSADASRLASIALVRRLPCAGDAGGDLVPVHRGNARIRPERVRSRMLKPLVRKIGAPCAGFHTLRHTYASLQLARGINIVQLSRVLGHHSPVHAERLHAPATGGGGARVGPSPTAGAPLMRTWETSPENVSVASELCRSTSPVDGRRSHEVGGPPTRPGDPRRTVAPYSGARIPALPPAGARGLQCRCAGSRSEAIHGIERADANGRRRQSDECFYGQGATDGATPATDRGRARRRAGSTSLQRARRPVWRATRPRSHCKPSTARTASGRRRPRESRLRAATRTTLVRTALTCFVRSPSPPATIEPLWDWKLRDAMGRPQVPELRP